ncbi:MAG: sulfotransferase [Acidimicrobiia bacterium]|nr:sulfotransferase [Acidimicrobiia bacterium]
MNHRHLFLIGAQRSASTLLASLLDQHPQIDFIKPWRPEPKAYLGDPIDHDEYDARWFARFQPSTVWAEKTTSYMSNPAAATRMATQHPSATVVAILREPVARAISNFRFSVDNGLETRPAEVALDPDTRLGARDLGISAHPHDYLGRSRYVEALQPWVNAFGHRSVHLFFTEEIAASTHTARRLFDQLDIDNRFRWTIPDDPMNASTSSSPELSPCLLERLAHYFAPWNAALAECIELPTAWAEGS